MTVHHYASQLNALLRRLTWSCRKYAMPAPTAVKRSVLSRYSAGTDVWIETGTYFGSTTKWLSARTAKVISIEPESSLAQRASRRLAKRNNVEIICGMSELVLPELLSKLEGSISFWLDGHFSGGITGGCSDQSPIQRELVAIEKHLANFSRVVLFVDDFRSFGSNHREVGFYPARSMLVDWAEKKNMSWTVEHDIFVASTAALP